MCNYSDLLSSRYIFKPIFHSFWLTHMLVNLPLQGPLRVYLCLACPLPSIAIGYHAQPPSFTPISPFTRMQQHYNAPPSPLQDYPPSISTSRSITSWLLNRSL